MSEEPRSAQPGAEPILPHLYRVADTCNSYCIVSERRGLLIDCGAGAPTRLRESMGISDFDACLFTHHHRDVCQGAPLLAKMGVPLLVPEHERHLFEDAELHWLTRRVYDSYNDRSTYNSLVEAVPVAESLEDYSTYPWRDYELRILATPGHTWGSQSFLVEIDGQRVAFVGDLLRDGGRLHTLHDTEYSYGGWEGLVQTHLSVCNLIREAPDLVCPAHGEPFADPIPQLEQLVERLEGLMKSIDQSPEMYGRFRAEAVTPHLIQVPDACCTFYCLLSDSGAGLFIDYGSPNWFHFGVAQAWGEPREIQRFVLHSIPEIREGYGLKGIDAVIPTHYHDDHVCGFPYLVEHEDTVVWCHEALREIIEHPERFSVMCLYPKGVPVGRAFLDGEPQQWREYTLRTWHYPGQTEYHCLILVEADGRRILFTGDSLFKEGGEWGSPIIFRNAFRPDSHRRCVEVLRQLPEVDLICPGHGPAFAPEPGWVDSFAARTDRLLSEFSDLLGADRFGPGVDPFRARIIPYTIAAQAGRTFRVEVEVRGYGEAAQRAVIRLHLPPEWVSLPSVEIVEVLPGQVSRAVFRVTPPENVKPLRRTAIAADVALNEEPLGQVAEAMVEFGPGPRLVLR